MPIIEWTEAYSVGVDRLDADHKRLIDIINRIDEVERSNRSVSWAIAELADYARYHFAREEQMMTEAGYGEAAPHRERHLEFLAWLRSVQVSLKVAPDVQFHLGDDLRDYLVRWLTEHILVEDMKYKGELTPPPP